MEVVMSKLSQQQCEACDAVATKVSEQQAQQLLLQLGEWALIERDAVLQLVRTFKFKNFSDALAFTNRVGALAEQQGHHPDLVTRWGGVEVYWWSHKLRGLHGNDFICAAKTDALYLE
ncbi:MAG: 4a-hydroxytetrahydrobiopterin dehydratase [Motiliproteus sp.]|jgi:4a-hydroxytetrahydrobiopterin dehydratase